MSHHAPAGLRFETHDTFGPLLPEWEALARATRNVFATAEWASLWWESYGGSARLRLVGARSAEGKLVGIVPLVITRVGPVRVARFLGHGMSDLLGPIRASDHGVTSPSLLEAALGEIGPQWDLFLGERLPGGDAWCEAGTSELRRESNMVLPLSRWPDWDAYVTALSRKLRQQIRHDEKALAKRHRLRFRMTREASSLPADLDTVFALHRARWEGRSSFVPGETFYRRFAALALERGWLRLWILEADSRPVAARYDFEYEGAYHAYNAGRDPAWRKAGVGLVLRAHTMREAMSGGAAEYRFLRGGEDYKKRFLTEDAGLVTVARGRTWLGRWAAQAGTLLRNRPRLRRLATQLVRRRSPVEMEE
ncbi:MAG TPA: GNAT family N-acetyltransferase [Candidatus Eisenbacteria bacterium]|nr:GNAT family N-acetyltransferase [Candidatus Eisenbacteria bacterium]